MYNKILQFSRINTKHHIIVFSCLKIFLFAFNLKKTSLPSDAIRRILLNKNNSKRRASSTFLHD